MSAHKRVYFLVIYGHSLTMVGTNLMKIWATLCVLCIVPSLLLGQVSAPGSKPGADGTASQPAMQAPTSPSQQPETSKAAKETPPSSAAGQSTPSVESSASAKAPTELG